ncbi:MAG TPA: hypothetical protein VNO23_03115 [Candidatus Binatia bacterium]|nr:hypothetical protein [Candidatus Binatia bacterium]
MSVLERELDHDLDPDDLDRDPWEPLRRIGAVLRRWMAALTGFAACIALPAAVAWLVSAGERFDILAPLIDPAVPVHLGRLGVFLSLVAAVVTTQSLLWLGRPFGIGHLGASLAAIALALFPSLASMHRMPFGLTPEQIAVAAAYAYLVLKVAVGVLVGGVVSWMLMLHVPAAAPARRLTPRK